MSISAMKRIDRPQGSFEYAQEGEGPDLLLVHSLLTDASVFDGIAPRLAGHRRVTWLNLPGYGASVQRSLTTIADYADFLCEALDALDLGAQTDLFANGFGAFVASEFALRHRGRIRRLIVADVNAGFPEAGRIPFGVMAGKVTEGGMQTVLDAAIGVPGIFMVMCAMGLAGIALLYLAVPAEPTRSGGGEGRSLASMVEILSRGQLRPLYLGIFTLHFIITSTFLAVPQVLKSDLAIPTAAHWKVYLGVFACSILGTVPLILRSERDRGADRLFVGAILLLVGSQLLLGLGHAHLWWVLGVLTLFFAVFNYLEARLPALLTHAAPPADRGAALGVFATAQFIGTFCGGAVGGVLLGRFGLSGVFWGTAAVAFIWAVAAWRAVSRAV